MLSIQYRMHPEICSFPSKQFYRGKLTTDPWEPLIQMINFFSNSLSFIYRKAIERRSKFLFKPYLVFNLSYSQEVDSDNENENTKEDTNKNSLYFQVVTNNFKDQTDALHTTELQSTADRNQKI